MENVRLRYQTLHIGDLDIHLRTLHDTQQFNDDKNRAADLGISSAMWPLFGVVWDSSQILAHLMSNTDIGDMRILEVGCGIGLASLVLSHLQADITATDYHPEAGNFLTQNVALNGGAPIPFFRTGWGDDDAGLGSFDLIIGSDLLYERDQLKPLATFMHRHAAEACEIILIDPGRDNRGRFSTLMTGLGYSNERQTPEPSPYLEREFKGQILRFSRGNQGDEGKKGEGE